MKFYNEEKLLKLRNILEILCNFGGLYEIEMNDIYKNYYEIWKNEMESEQIK